MVLVVALILQHLQVQTLGFQTKKTEWDVSAYRENANLKTQNLRQLVYCLRANEKETEDSQHGGSILTIALQQNTIHNTQEDMKGWSRVGSA